MERLKNIILKKLHRQGFTKAQGFSTSDFMHQYMKFIAILGQFPSLLQIIKTLKTQSSGDISVPGLILALFCSSSWLIYGIFLRDRPLIISGILSSLLTSLNITVTVMYW